MLPLRHLRGWQFASLVLLVVVLVATLMPAVWFWDDKVKVLSLLKMADKWFHGITFLVLTVWFTGLYRTSAYWRVGIGLLLFGIFIEICQRLVGYRTADWLDVAADAGGIIAGLIIGVAGLGGWCLRVEAHLAERRT